MPRKGGSQGTYHSPGNKGTKKIHKGKGKGKSSGSTSK